MRSFLLLGASLLLTPMALAQPSADGIDWVTIGSPNNPAYNGPDPDGYTAGRGSVPYEYRIGRTEVTTQLWMDFYNAAKARPDPLPITLDVSTPVHWGATIDGSYTGPGTRFRLKNLPDAAMLPVGGISWRTAAVLCNWLENGRGTSQASFMNGVYDVSTFSGVFTWTDQAAHSPNARYWIPTLDEWIKAAHFDPNKLGPGQPGWWKYPTRSDVPPMYGPPGQGQANVGFDLPNDAQFNIPLGAYPQTPSPWGLLDVSGATKEYTETILQVEQFRTRRFQGGFWDTGSGSNDDLIYGAGGVVPSEHNTYAGLRLASVIPSPGVLLPLTSGLTVVLLRRRRPGNHAQNNPWRHVPRGITDTW